MKFGKQRVLNLTSVIPIITLPYYGFVYQWTNTLNNKKYIGKHKGQISDGYTGQGKIFIKAVKKYGIDSFIRNILEVVYEQSESKLQEREKYWLDFYQVTKSDEFYNISAVSSGGCTTAKYTPEYRSAYMQRIVNKSQWKRKQKRNYLKAIRDPKWKVALLSGQKRRRSYIGEQNPKFKGWWLTPFGKFPGQIIAAKNCNVSFLTIRNRCLHPNSIVRQRNLPKEWFGKTWKELGWNFVPVIPADLLQKVHSV